MSRYGDDGDYDYDPVAQRLWDANYERALKGKRGRKALADLRDALRALPEPKLIAGALCTVNPERRHPGPDSLVRFEFEEHVEDDGAGVCAIGALLWHRKVKAGMDPGEAFDSLPTYLDSDYDLHETAQLAVRDADIAYPMAWMLAYRNDEMNDTCTPEERYAAFLEWIDAELAEPAAA
jgi:hypothetical protein